MKNLLIFITIAALLLPGCSSHPDCLSREGYECSIGPNGETLYVKTADLSSMGAASMISLILLKTTEDAAGVTVYQLIGSDLVKIGVMVAPVVVVADLVLNPNLLQQMAEGNPTARVGGQYYEYSNGQWIQAEENLAKLAEGQQEQAAANSNAQAADTESFRYPAPDGWKPPDKKHCGEDLVTYFAYLFAEDTTLKVFLSSGMEGEAFLKTPMGEATQKIEAEKASVTKRLKKNGCYFYSGEPKSSVFTDYKIMRDQAPNNIIATKSSQVNTNSSYKDVMDLCSKEVLSWWP